MRANACSPAASGQISAHESLGLDGWAGRRGLAAEIEEPHPDKVTEREGEREQ